MPMLFSIFFFLNLSRSFSSKRFTTPAPFCHLIITICRTLHLHFSILVYCRTIVLQKRKTSKEPSSQEPDIKELRKEFGKGIQVFSSCPSGRRLSEVPGKHKTFTSQPFSILQRQCLPSAYLPRSTVTH